MKYKKFLYSKKAQIAVWGTGFIGLSTMAYFAKRKVKCIGYDISEKKVNTINKGKLPLPELKNWFGFDIKNLVSRKYLKATNNYKELINKNTIVHFVAIPTEKKGKPFFDILFDVLRKIIEIKKIKCHLKPVVIIESTLTPQFSEKKIIPFFNKHNIKVGQNLLYAVAPRRDWFVEGTKSLLTSLQRASGKRFVYTASNSVVIEGKHISNGTEELPYTNRFNDLYFSKDL